MSSRFVFVAFLIVFILLVAGIVYMYLKPINPSSYSGTPKSTSSTISTSTTNEQLDKDSQNLGQSLNTIDAQMQEIDKGLNDQAPNLQ